jgi:NAD(P)-dependent dehydrogenase (short-subunit alcohol dehydrogenase family)
MADADRVALVSGANRGIGAEISRQLAAEHGFTVLAGSRDPGAVDTREGIVPVSLDVTEQASIDALAERLAADPGSLDVLVNNAGVMQSYGDTIESSDLELAHDIVETNVFGAWRLTRATLPLLRESDDGRVVNVSSGAGQLDDMQGGYPAYRVSKAGLNVLTRVLTSEEPALSVNSMCPGWVRTDMGGSGAPKSVEEGADSAVWLATAPDVGSGGFYRDRRPIPW